jgi:hypothetical protein
MNLQWISSTGGPLVNASPQATKAWRGTKGSSVNEARGDYERACDQQDYISILPGDSSQVLIFGDEPLPSAFVVKSDSIIVVRWVACISSECAANAIAQLPSVLPALDEPIRFRIDDRKLIMFDSALDSIDPVFHPSVEINPGLFTVTTEKYEREGLYEFMIHRILRAQHH